MKKILITAVLVAWAGTLYGAYLWGSNQGPSDSMTAAAGRELSADDRLDAAVRAAGRELSADERFDAAVQAAGRELTANDRFDAFNAALAAGRELSADDRFDAARAAGLDRLDAALAAGRGPAWVQADGRDRIEAAIQAARRKRTADAVIQGVRQAACSTSLPIASIFCITFPLD